MNQKTKQIIIAIIIISIAFVIFKVSFPNGGVETDTALVTDNNAPAEVIDGQIILTLLENLKVEFR